MTAFDPRFASRIAAWVQSDQELTWLAPGTPPPLTARKIVAWEKKHEHRFLFWHRNRDDPIGYAELNDMPREPRVMWIGHFLVDPAQRGRSFGSRFARALLASAFVEYRATEVLLVVFPDNMPAIRCYQQAGMSVIGHERKYFQTTRRQHAFLRMGIDRARYAGLVAVGRLPAEPLPFFAHPCSARPHAAPA